MLKLKSNYKLLWQYSFSAKLWALHNPTKMKTKTLPDEFSSSFFKILITVTSKQYLRMGAIFNDRNHNSRFTHHDRKPWKTDHIPKPWFLCYLYIHNCQFNLLTPVGKKRAHKLKQTCSFQLQVSLSMCDLFVTTRHENVLQSIQGNVIPIIPI